MDISMNSPAIRQPLRRLGSLIALICMTVPASTSAQSDSKAVGVRPTAAVFAPLADQAQSGCAGMFVGVNEFTVDQGLSRLYYAVHDAVETAYLFVFELKLIPAQNCYILISGEPDARPEAAIVRQHLEQLRKAGATVTNAQRSTILTTFLKAKVVGRTQSDLFVCSFSSHGFNQGPSAFIMPSDGSRQLLALTAVPLATIEQNMSDEEQGSKAGHRLLLVDACQERIPARGGSTGAATEKTSRAFADELKKPTGQSKLASCGPGEFSFEADGLGGVGHGVFTHSFLEALRGGAASDSQQLVRLGPVADFVATSVTRWTQDSGKPKQTPFLTGPVDANKLPLAMKADDLTTLIVTVRKQPPRGGFSDTFRDQLAEALSKSNPSLATDRRFVTNTRKFIQGEFDAGLFIPYATGEVTRLLSVDPGVKHDQLVQQATKLKASNSHLSPSGSDNSGKQNNKSIDQFVRDTHLYFEATATRGETLHILPLFNYASLDDLSVIIGSTLIELRESPYRLEDASVPENVSKRLLEVTLPADIAPDRTKFTLVHKDQYFKLSSGKSVELK